MCRVHLDVHHGNAGAGGRRHPGARPPGPASSCAAFRGACPGVPRTWPVGAGGGPLIRLQRWGGRPPRDDELLEIDPDGTFRMRRTVGPATRPATPVGRFGGMLPAASRKALADLAARLEDAPAERNPLPMDASVDELTVDGAGGTAAGPAGIAFSGAWGELAQVLRGMLVDLAAHPLAAIALASSDEGLRLEHLGFGGPGPGRQRAGCARRIDRTAGPRSRRRDLRGIEWRRIPGPPRVDRSAAAGAARRPGDDHPRGGHPRRRWHPVATRRSRAAEARLTSR